MYAGSGIWRCSEQDDDSVMWPNGFPSLRQKWTGHVQQLKNVNRKYVDLSELKVVPWALVGKGEWGKRQRHAVSAIGIVRSGEKDLDGKFFCFHSSRWVRVYALALIITGSSPLLNAFHWHSRVWALFSCDRSLMSSHYLRTLHRRSKIVREIQII